MSEWVSTRRTTYGWLAWLASLGFGDPDLDLVAEHCPLAVAVIDLRTRRSVILTPLMVALLGLAEDDSASLDLRLVVEDRSLLDALLDMLLDGSIDAYESHGSLRRQDGELLEAQTWTVVTREERRRALYVVVPVGGAARFRPPEPTPAEWPTAGSGSTIGIIDRTFGVQRVSPDIEQLMGLSAAEAVGRPLTDFVHPDDVSTLRSVYSQAQDSLASGGLVARMGPRGDHWVDVQIILAPLAPAGDEQLSVFAFFIAPLNIPTRARRISTLEGHLRRIAEEVEQAGLALHPELDQQAATIPGLSDFSIRQLEVLRHLIRGERVPGIAKSMLVSQSTVRNHLSEMFRKVGVHSQEDLLVMIRGANPSSDR